MVFFYILQILSSSTLFSTVDSKSIFVLITLVIPRQIMYLFIKYLANALERKAPSLALQYLRVDYVLHILTLINTLKHVNILRSPTNLLIKLKSQYRICRQ